MDNMQLYYNVLFIIASIFYNTKNFSIQKWHVEIS